MKSPGQTIQFLVDTPLAEDTYWWRVRAGDPLGSATFGAWSDPRSFTASSSAASSSPLADWYQTTTEQFQEDSLANAATMGDAVFLASETGLGVLATPDIARSELTLDPGTIPIGWGRVVVNVSHPDANTAVAVSVRDSGGSLIAGPVSDTGAGTRDVELDLSGVSAPAIYVVVVMTAGSSPQINEISVSGASASLVPALGAPGVLLLLAVLVAASLLLGGGSRCSASGRAWLRAHGTDMFCMATSSTGGD